MNSTHCENLRGKSNLLLFFCKSKVVQFYSMPKEIESDTNNFIVSNKLQLEVRNLEIFLSELFWIVAFYPGWLVGTIQETKSSFSKILTALCGRAVVENGYKTQANWLYWLQLHVFSLSSMLCVGCIAFMYRIDHLSVG